jgi:hypothetical protein
MKLKAKLFLSSGVLASALFSASFSGAQQKPASVQQASITYDLSRETVIQGTVVSYTAASEAPPAGAHATIKTASGLVDVHLGNPYLIKKNDIFLATGDSVRIVGESEPIGAGTFFAARVLQKGSQTVTLRNKQGIPISPRRVVSTSSAKSSQGGAQ